MLWRLTSLENKTLAFKKSRCGHPIIARVCVVHKISVKATFRATQPEEGTTLRRTDLLCTQEKLMMDWSCEAISASSEQHFATRRLSRWGKRCPESCTVTSLFIWINVPFGAVLIILNFSFGHIWEFRPTPRFCEFFSTHSYNWLFSELKQIILRPVSRNVQSVQVNSLVPCQRAKAHDDLATPKGLDVHWRKHCWRITGSLPWWRRTPSTASTQVNNSFHVVGVSLFYHNERKYRAFNTKSKVLFLLIVIVYDRVFVNWMSVRVLFMRLHVCGDCLSLCHILLKCVSTTTFFNSSSYKSWPACETQADFQRVPVHRVEALDLLFIWTDEPKVKDQQNVRKKKVWTLTCTYCIMVIMVLFSQVSLFNDSFSNWVYVVVSFKATFGLMLASSWSTWCLFWVNLFPMYFNMVKTVWGR